MRRAALGVCMCICLYASSSCTARAPIASAPAPTPTLFLSPSLPADTRLCVPLETFRHAGVACLTVGELRALLRGRRQITFGMQP